jgi:hypothetical protein
MRTLNWTFGYNNWTIKEKKKVSFLSVFWNCSDEECIYRENADEYLDCRNCNHSEKVRVRYEAIVEFFISPFNPPPAYKGFKGCPGRDDCLACEEDIRVKTGDCFRVEFFEIRSDVEIMDMRGRCDQVYTPASKEEIQDKFEEMLAKILDPKSYFCSKECLDKWSENETMYLS